MYKLNCKVNLSFYEMDTTANAAHKINVSGYVKTAQNTVSCTGLGP